MAHLAGVVESLGASHLGSRPRTGREHDERSTAPVGRAGVRAAAADPRTARSHRRGTRLLCLFFAPPAVVFFVGGVVGYATLEPGQDDFGAAMMVVFALVFGIPVVVLGLRWRAASRSLRQRAEEHD